MEEDRKKKNKTGATKKKGRAILKKDGKKREIHLALFHYLLVRLIIYHKLRLGILRTETFHD